MPRYPSHPYLSTCIVLPVFYDWSKRRKDRDLELVSSLPVSAILGVYQPQENVALRKNVADERTRPLEGGRCQEKALGTRGKQLPIINQPPNRSAVQLLQSPISNTGQTVYEAGRQPGKPGWHLRYSSSVMFLYV